MAKCTAIVLAPHCQSSGLRKAVQATIGALDVTKAGVKVDVALLVDDKGGDDLVWIVDNLADRLAGGLFVSPNGPTGWPVQLSNMLELFTHEVEDDATFVVIQAGVAPQHENWLERALYDLDAGEGDWAVEVGTRVEKSEIRESYMCLGEEKFAIPQLSGGAICLRAAFLRDWRPVPYLPLYPDSVGGGIWGDLTDEIHSKGMEIITDLSEVVIFDLPETFLTDIHVGVGGFPQLLTTKEAVDAAAQRNSASN